MVHLHEDRQLSREIQCGYLRRFEGIMTFHMASLVIWYPIYLKILEAFAWAPLNLLWTLFRRSITNWELKQTWDYIFVVLLPSGCQEWLLGLMRNRFGLPTSAQILLSTSVCWLSFYISCSNGARFKLEPNLIVKPRLNVLLVWR